MKPAREGEDKRRSLLVPPSRVLLWLFEIYIRLFVPRHFHALRLASAARFPLEARPLIVCINHPSWWDPLSSILISRYLLRSANHYAPIDAVSLRRYGLLGRMGLFPVEQGTPRGAVQFLRAADQILAQPQAVLWLTPQGEFTDARARPVIFKAGLDALVRRMPTVTVVPMAYEYIFWDERLPEILSNCGQPLVFERGVLVNGRVDSAADKSLSAGSVIAHALTNAQQELRVLAMERDASRFTTVLIGGTGTGGIYALWQRLFAAFRGERYHPEHTHGANETQAASEIETIAHRAHATSGVENK